MATVLKYSTDYLFRPALTVFLVVMTNFILLIGAGLFSRAVGSFQEQKFNTLYVSLCRIPTRSSC